jgi:VanZ family protein
MGRLPFKGNFLFATAVVIAVIVYGSLYPFAFRPPVIGFGRAARALIESWNETPSRGDFIANVALYLPLGFFAILAIGRGVGTAKRIALAVLTGALLSTCMELTQFYDDGRQTAATDLYANVVGTTLGAIGGSLTGSDFRWPLLREIASNRVPALLLSAWAGYRLFPYVPTTDLHKYWDTLKPVILYPSLTGYDLFRYTAIWLTIGALIEPISGPKRVRQLFPLFVGGVLVAKVMMVETMLTTAEIAGAALALCAWSVLAVHVRLRVSVIALLFCGYVIAERLEPFQFGSTAASFSWVPFLGFMSSSPEIGVLSFFQKFFLFGSSIWLLAQAGLRLRLSIAIVAAILFMTSYAEAYLPNRSAEVTDTVMALIIGAVFALIEKDTRRDDSPVKEPQRHPRLTVSKRELAANRPVADPRTIGPSRVNDREPDPAAQANTAAAFREHNRRNRETPVGLVVAAICFALAAAIAVNYPLVPRVLGIALMLYVLALWHWPSLWLAVIPAVLPALDLTTWTGWTQVGEPDLFVLVTIGILALRAPPRSADFRLNGFPAVVLALSLISYFLSVALGLALPGPEGGSDNPYLRSDNALRLAKGFFTALALLPFLRARMRTRGDTMVWFGTGMAAGLTLVAAAVLAERAVFSGLFDFKPDYRVVGTFSSMHDDSGHVGAYIAMALPFLLVCLVRPRLFTLLAMFGIAIGTGYVLVVTFAPAAYAATLISTLTAGLGWAWAARHRRSETASALALSALLLPLTIGGIVVAAVSGGFMTEQLRTVASDLADREGNWSGGLALPGSSPATALFGMGLGTYPRIGVARKLDERFPTNFVVAQDGGYHFLSIYTGLPTYLGQKVPVRPDQQYRVFVALRSPDGKGVLSVILCEKMLLYSANCRDTTFRSHLAGTWEDFGAEISSAGLDEDATLLWFKRPVELDLFDPVPGSTIEIGHIRMLDPQGHDILANGDFSQGTERWYFADDVHLIQRIKDQYFMSLFEGGALGLASFVLIAGTALTGAVRAMARGDQMAAAVVAALVAFLFSGVFDYLLEVPRLAALFYLIVFCGLTMMQTPMHGPAASAISRDRSASRSDRPAKPG